MAFTHKIQTIYSDASGILVSNTVNYSENGTIGFNDAIPTATVNREIDIAFLRANLKSIIITSDRALTIKTNSSGSPADTIALAAGVPLVWGFGSPVAIPFSADVTKIYVSNASGFTANLVIAGCAHISV